MLGLVVRILISCAVVFAVVYGITRALRANASSKQAQRIADEIKKLRESIAAGAMDPGEYRSIAQRIRDDCRRLGIDAPDLPDHLPPRDASEE